MFDERMTEADEWLKKRRRRRELEEAKGMLMASMFWMLVWAVVMFFAFSSIKL